MTDTREMVLEVEDLHVSFETPDGPVDAVRGVSLNVRAGETVAIVGESGSGKSQVMMSAMGLLASNGRASGRIRYRGRDILNMPPSELNRLRGAKITMIFQEPMTSLDPLFTIESQMSEPLRVHGGLNRKQASQRVLELLKLVQIPNPEKRLRAYPHELSGGQRQRVMIAMALANDPDLLIADEPTTALDVTIQAEILQLLSDLQARLGMSILFITHDLGIVEAFADRTYVMCRGRVEEQGPTADVFHAPKTDYTKMLLAAEPEGHKKPPRETAPVLLEGEDIQVTFGLPAGFLRKSTELHAVRGIDIALREGQTIGVVGESGSGKSTLGRALLQMIPSTGRVVCMGSEIGGLDRKAMRPHRKGLQMVFQDPYGSLSPRMTVREIVTEGLLVHEPGLGAAERDRRAEETLRDVGLDPSVKNRFPHEFSGGQRQRIAIARAVILRPRIIILDEPTSALDRSVQKQVIDLLRRLQIENSLSYIFISHDLAVVRALSDYVMVMRNGAVVEQGPVDQLFDAPKTDYTRELMRAAFDLRSLLTG
ncbi:ABC transporter ATP-binding protein [Amaricoccus tamworthensis]|uniref:ABC transporter ATP-binding protein n=1 Tax=Amaricoccus tamworthensis TaxID=57002 RepID=UPI003C7D5CF7